MNIGLRKRSRFLISALMVILVVLVTGCPSTPPSMEQMELISAQAPAKPADLVATVGQENITVSWAYDSNATSFDLYKAEASAGKYNLITSLTPADDTDGRLVYTDTAVADGEVACYYVVARRSFTLASGKVTELTAQSDIVTGSSTPLFEYNFTAGSETVKLNWNLSGIEYNGNKLIDGYTVIVSRVIDGSSDSGFTSEELAGSLGTYTDTAANGLLTDMSYDYTITYSYTDPVSGETVSKSIGPVSVTTSLNLIPAAVPADALTASDSLYSVSNNALVGDSIDLSWSVSVPESIVTDPKLSPADSAEVTNAHPEFLLERSVKDADEWTTAMSYDAFASAYSAFYTAEDFEKMSVIYDASAYTYVFSYSYTDTGLASDTEYEYRLSMRYKYSDTWITVGDSGATVQNNTGSTLKSFTSFYVSSSNKDTATSDKKVTADLVWEIPYDTLPEGLSYIIEYYDQEAETLSWTTAEPVYGEDGLSATVEFSLTDEEIKSDHSYSYRIWYTADGVTSYSETSAYKAEVPSNNVVSIEGTEHKFSVVDRESLIASTNYADKIVLTWSTALNPAAPEDSSRTDYSSLTMEPENISYVVRSISSGKTLFSGKATELDYEISSENVMTVSCMDSEPSASDSYIVTATYEGTFNGNPIVAVSSSNSASGKILAAATDMTVVSGGERTIPVSFKGDSEAVGYYLYYRYSGDSEWIKYDTLIANEAYSAETTASEATVTYKTSSVDFSELSGDEITVKGRPIEFSVSNWDGSAEKQGSEVLGSGKYFGVYGFALTPSVAVSDGVANTDSVTIAWSEVTGAGSYIVEHSFDNGSTFSLVDDAFVLSDDGLSGTESVPEGVALNGAIVYRVMPVSSEGNEVSSADVPTATSYYFAPPETVIATKGTYLRGIKITWEAVENATGYNIYRKLGTDKDTAWSESDFLVSVSTNSYENAISTTAETYIYKVTALYESTESYESKLQYYSATDSVDSETYAGYSFLDVDDTVSMGVEDGKLKLTFNEVRGATKYIVSAFGAEQTFESDSYTVDNSQISVLTDMYVKYNGYYASPTKDAYTVRAENESVSDSSGDFKDSLNDIAVKTWTSDSITDDVNVLISAVNYALRPHFNKANSNWSGDWWAPNSGWWGSTSASTNTYDETGIHIQSARGGGSYTEQTQQLGYMTLSNFTIDDQLVLNTKSGDNVYLWAGNGSSYSGYRGVDPLQTIGEDNNNGVSGVKNTNRITASFVNGTGDAFTLAYHNVQVLSGSSRSAGYYTVTYGSGYSKNITDNSNIYMVLNV